MTAMNSFPPVQGAIAQAEAWTRYLDTRQAQLDGRTPETVGSLEPIVLYAVKLGEMLSLHWRIVSDELARSGHAWTTVKEFESARESVRLMFFTAREAMEKTLKSAEAIQHLTGQKFAGLDRLLAVIEDARRLDEVVFRDWPSFADPLPPTQPADSLPVDESLAEALGISVGEARQRMDARRREVNAGRA